MSPDSPKKLLIVNLHFAPFSFGGGTIVAEACAQRLRVAHGWQVLVLTVIRDYNLPDYTVRRYAIDGIDVVAVVINSEPDYQLDYDNPRFDQIARSVVQQYQPDVCHAHALQGLGVGWLGSLQTAGSSLAVTLHDCWWLCDRQFMINSDGNYCNQTRVSHEQCRYCTANYSHLLARDATLKKALSQADILLYPSEFHRTLHVDSGLDSQKSLVNKNGINMPTTDYAPLRQQALAGRRNTVFGFTGGPGKIKGAPHILQAFEEADLAAYTLQIVDSAQNLGTSWQSSEEWQSSAKIDFVPAYTQDTMDTFFAGIDVLLFPSQWKESFGLTVREALARDVWVIATDCGAPVEDIVDGENGTIIPFDFSHHGLKVAVEQLADREWRDYQNPHKESLHSFDQQAAELDNLLTALV